MLRTAWYLGGSCLITDPWIDCNICGSSYGLFLSSCPSCGTTNPFTSTPAIEPPKKNTSAKIGLGVGIAIVAVAAAILTAPTLTLMLQDVLSGQQKSDNPAITILQPGRQEPKFVAREELVEQALDLINTDRDKFGLQPVALSLNQAAQAHAEDVFQNKQISHWMSNGEKPYMTYTKYDGAGSVQQNVAIAGFSLDQYQKCSSNILYNCEKIDPMETIRELQYEMMYKDKECCNDGHRNNILNDHHTDVSIGIAYDDYYLAFVQNFENNYGLEITVNGGQVSVIGSLLKGTLDHIGVWYDEMPTTAIYEQNKRMLSYSGGDQVAVVTKPLPFGYYYEKPDGYDLIVADKWTTQDNAVDIRFDLSSAVKKDGVYTLSAVIDDRTETFEATSYSIFVESEDSTDR